MTSETKNNTIFLICMLLYLFMAIKGVIGLWNTYEAFYPSIYSTAAHQYAYAMFLANALLTNCLFNLGRSNIFLENNNPLQQRTLYYAANSFLAAAVVAVALSVYAYLRNVSPEPDPEFNRNTTVLAIVSFSLSSIGGALWFNYFIVKWLKWPDDKKESKTMD